MAQTRVFIIVGVALAMAGAWYVFRPETAFIDRQVDEPPPSGEATVLLAGSFMPRAHEGRGLAHVLELPGNRRVLRFSDFESLDGPDLYVYLVASPEAADAEDLERSGFLSLGPLKGNLGAQNYNIPPDADLTRYRGVVIWCRRFGVNFTTALLAAPNP